MCKSRGSRKVSEGLSTSAQNERPDATCMCLFVGLALPLMSFSFVVLYVSVVS